MLIEFGQIGTHLGTRFAGASVREKIISSFGETDKFVFDFTGVETVSNSFADECFAKLIFNFEMEYIKGKTTFQNASPFIKAVIANAFKERLSKSREVVV
ncbi:STAS-like domain-containing protein [Limnovirga soli]|uniref:DUF4325 domain-containing protein n=1 Tax=Limnovirga soli TaxID=2656915 RepID=A0A8J8FE75_9BACT|nr:STAS-like domain-containing protein [Limnovirga soli]NNV55058.1 DUF4325 domain-containing protein [Limnovirga soli]